MAFSKYFIPGMMAASYEGIELGLLNHCDLGIPPRSATPEGRSESLTVSKLKGNEADVNSPSTADVELGRDGEVKNHRQPKCCKYNINKILLVTNFTVIIILLLVILLMNII